LRRTRPWQLAEPGPVLGELLNACRTLAELLTPFLPDAAKRIAEQCAGPVLPAPRPLFPRI
jgi:methionyl-tRNA synthetase